MTEIDPHINEKACQLLSPPARQTPTLSPIPPPQPQQPGTRSADAQLDAELSELFDGAAPSETPSSPPSTRQAEPVSMDEPDVQLDAELSEVFDKPEPAVTEVPQSPPPSVPPPRKRSLAHALRANAQRLSLSAACKKTGAGDRQPASSVPPVKKNAASKPPSAEETEPPAVDTTKATGEDKEGAKPRADAHMSDDVAPASMRELMERRLAAKSGTSQKRRAASNSSMQVINASDSKSQLKISKGQFSYHDRDTTNISLKGAPYDSATLQALFEHNTRVDIGELGVKGDRFRDGSIRNPIVFGVVVEKHSKKRAKDGSSYAVWTLYNMPRFKRNGSAPSSVLLLLFGAAFERWHNVVPGAVFALRKPTLLPPRQAEKQQVRGVCLKVSVEKQLLYLGVCGDYAVCESFRYDGRICGKWYDANRLTMCTFHRTQKVKQLTSSRRMEVNNAVRPSMKRATPSDERKLSSMIQTGSESVRQRRPSSKGNKYEQKDKKRLRRLRDSRQMGKATSTDEKQPSQMTGVRRKQYTNAVYTLEHLGFTLDEHGSLLAPRDDTKTAEYGPLLKRARSQPAEDRVGVARTTDQTSPKSGSADGEHATLMELSDESDSDDGD